MAQTIILAIIGSGAFTTLVQVIVSSIQNRKGKLKAIEDKLGEIEKNQKTAEKDALRTQLLMMIASYPEEKTDIMRLAEYYFHRLDGNWIAKAIFNKWLEQYCDGFKPEWFNEGGTK